jgi:hypothetical protein
MHPFGRLSRGLRAYRASAPHLTIGDLEAPCILLGASRILVYKGVG